MEWVLWQLVKATGWKPADIRAMPPADVMWGLQMVLIEDAQTS